MVVLTPEKKLLEAEVKSVRIPLADGGSMGILPGHAKLIAATDAGDVSYVDMQGNPLRVKLGAGILQVESDIIQVLTNVFYDEKHEKDEKGEEDDDLLDRITREIVEKLKVESDQPGRPVSSDEE